MGKPEKITDKPVMMVSLYDSVTNLPKPLLNLSKEQRASITELSKAAIRNIQKKLSDEKRNIKAERDSRKGKG